MVKVVIDKTSKKHARHLKKKKTKQKKKNKHKATKNPCVKKGKTRNNNKIKLRGK